MGLKSDFSGRNFRLLPESSRIVVPSETAENSQNGLYRQTILTKKPLRGMLVCRGKLMPPWEWRRTMHFVWGGAMIAKAMSRVLALAFLSGTPPGRSRSGWCVPADIHCGQPGDGRRRQPAPHRTPETRRPRLQWPGPIACALQLAGLPSTGLPENRLGSERR